LGGPARTVSERVDATEPPVGFGFGLL